MTERMATLPRSFPRVPVPVKGEVRRGLIGRYRYWLIFELVPEPAAAVVLSFWPTQRRPDGWKLEN